MPIAIIDEIPKGKRVIAVTWSNTGQSVILREMWVHLLAYYQTRRSGQIAYSFAQVREHARALCGRKVAPLDSGRSRVGRREIPSDRALRAVLEYGSGEDPGRKIPASDPRARTFRAAAVGG